MDKNPRPKTSLRFLVSLSVVGIILVIVSLGLLYLWTNRLHEAKLRVGEGPAMVATVATDRQVEKHLKVDTATSAYFLTLGEEAALIEKIEQVATATGVEYELNNADDGSDLKLTMTARGSFVAVSSFTEALENMMPLVTIQQLVIKQIAPISLKFPRRVWQAELVATIARH